MGPYLMDIFIEKHRVLSLIRLAMAYIATNVDLGYLSIFLAFDSESALETFLTGLGKDLNFSFLACRM